MTLVLYHKRYHSSRVKAADSWSELQAAARELEQRREQEGLEYGDPSALEVKQLVSYVFRARKSKGVSEYQAPKAKAVDFLDALPAGEMQQLLLSARSRASWAPFSWVPR